MDTDSRRTRSHRCLGALAGTALVVALAASACDTAPDGPDARRSATPRALAPAAPEAAPPRSDEPGSDEPGSPWATDQPTIAHLDPALLAAVQAAARAAEQDGVRLSVTSGWRSRSHQERLFSEAVRRYGSEEEARRYVATPDRSKHVTGDAVDIGPTDADVWLVEHGAAYGLCQILSNEIWHFELATTPGGDCPDLLPDASSAS